MSSCEFLEIKKYSADLLLKEEVQAMNWEEVDVYPVFKECEELAEVDQLACFISSLHSKITNAVQRYADIYSIDDLKRIDLQIEVSKEKELSFSIKDKDSLSELSTDTQSLEAYIQEGLDSIQVVAPALKRGVPVTTVFALPIIFSLENQ